MFTLQDFMLDKSYSTTPSAPLPLPSLPCIAPIRPVPSTESFLGSRGGLLQSILTSTPAPESTTMLKTEPTGSAGSDSGYDSKATFVASARSSADGTLLTSPKRKFPSSLSSHSSSASKSTETPQRKRRFERTRSALQQSGLLDITMSIADLMKSSRKLDEEVAQLRRNSQDLLRSILNNPQNSPLREFLLQKHKEREMQDK